MDPRTPQTKVDTLLRPYARWLGSEQTRVWTPRPSFSLSYRSPSYRATHFFFFFSSIAFTSLRVNDADVLLFSLPRSRTVSHPHSASYQVLFTSICVPTQWCTLCVVVALGDTLSLAAHNTCDGFRVATTEGRTTQLSYDPLATLVGREHECSRTQLAVRLREQPGRQLFLSLPIHDP